MSGLFIIMLIFVVTISWLWVRGIDNMKKNHPNYKGEDFLNWDEKQQQANTKTADWDDNKIHTENGF